MVPTFNLPAQLTNFVGREHEIAEISRLLTERRLVTLMGTGGSGKTRLALQVASLLTADYEEVCFVELDTISDPSLVPQVVATALGIREETGPARALTAAIASYLGDKHALLVLDNCEHLGTACPSLVDTLLRSCGHLRILATSRHALGVPGEITWTVPALSLPESEPGQLSFETISGYDAVQLFVDRAAQSRPGFALTPQNAEAVAQLCRQLDGLPLAIELAAARVKVLSVEQIIERLGERFRLLISSDQADVPRRHTLQALMDWSYDLLTDTERTVLRGLSVFAGSFSLEAVVSIFGGDIDEYELIDLLSHLSDKSLILMEIRDRQARYRLLETIRQYAAGKVQAADELVTLLKRHRDWYTGFIERAQPGLSSGEEAESLNRLETEHDNIRAALRWTINEEKNANNALTMAAMLWRFWDMRGYISEGRKWLAEALSAPGEVAPLARARALSAAGNLAIAQGDFEYATKVHTEALHLRREAGDPRSVGASLSNLGVVARSQGDYGRAAQLYEESLSIFRSLENDTLVAGVLSNLGFVAQSRGQYVEAEQLFTEAMTLSRKVGDTLGVVIALNNLGEVAQARGDYEQAKEFYEQGLELDEELGDKLGIVGLINNLASVAHYEGNQDKAVMLYRQSLLISRDLGHLPGIVECLEGLAIEEAPLDYPRAARLFGAAAQLRERIGAPVAPNEKREYDKQVDLVRARLGPTYEAAFEAGKALPFEVSVNLALQLPQPVEAYQADRAPSNEDTSAAAQNEGRNPWNLTKRELEVLRLVANGSTDAQVAHTLTISTRTVHSHLHSIYEKLGVTGRNAAGHKAAEYGLV